ncbi:MAG: asparagine--tRNA ligase [Bacilli bacterium]|nr:asparagine--tRNA ligase [Bacilli bacterium]
MEIKELYLKNYLGQDVKINGWIRSHRKQAHFGFIDLFDGTCFKSIQIVYDEALRNFEEVSKLLVGSSICVSGIVVESMGKQAFEIKATEIAILGYCEETYPIQPKRHTREFLRDVAYLRPRTALFQAIFRIRSVASMAIHTYFQDRGYVYFHAPIITASDCEGAGEMFRVTTLDLKNKNLKDEDDFFGKVTGLTVSGQLEAETFASAFSKCYTFGPTFRAENSNTKIHASEFWMVEPEVAFCDLDGIMDIEEEFLKFIVSYVLKRCPDEIEFLDKFVEKGLKNKLESLLNSHFVRITHKEVIDILKKADVSFEFAPEYGEDIAKEHEKYITEYFGTPVFIKDWPRDIKAFYMKQNEDGETVRAVDLEVPGVGELIGGSEREASYEKLVTRMKELGMNIEELDWYVNLRKFGTVPHSGFGLGFERLLIYLTGVDNIRDVIPYPRTPKSCDF